MKTEASRGIGIDELVTEFEEHRKYLIASGTINRFIDEKNAAVFSEMLKERLFSLIHERLVTGGELQRIVAGMATRSVDLYSAVEEVINYSLVNPLAAAK